MEVVELNLDKELELLLGGPELLPLLEEKQELEEFRFSVAFSDVSAMY
jgi:hypothetical protein